MLDNKRILVTGVVNTESIAFAVAQAAQSLGAEVILTAFPRDRDLTKEAAKSLRFDSPIYDLDATNPDQVEALTESLRDEFDYVDGALHSIAFAPRDALSGSFVDTDTAGLDVAFQTSAVSYAVLARMVSQLHAGRPASVVGLDFGSGGAWPVYNWMGVCKAALNSVSRYVARDLGPEGIRSNLVAAGPLHTRAAGGIPGFEHLLNAWESGSPIPWDPNDARPVADAVCFLLSDMARAITGETINVDGGYHAMAAPLAATDSVPAVTATV